MTWQIPVAVLCAAVALTILARLLSGWLARPRLNRAAISRRLD